MFFTSVHTADWVMAAILYFVRMFGITAGYHRYFAHRSYKTSRVVSVRAGLDRLQRLAEGAAVVGGPSSRTIIVTATRSRIGIRRVVETFWHAHVGWILDSKNDATDYDGIRDFAKYPELVWLNRLHWVPGILLGAACFGFSWLVTGNGWGGLVAFVISTVAGYHFTFMINSLAHVFGSRRYETTDDSRNNFALALMTTGRRLAQQPSPLPERGPAGVLLVGSGYQLLQAQGVERGRLWSGTCASRRKQMLEAPFNRPGGSGGEKSRQPKRPNPPAPFPKRERGVRFQGYPFDPLPLPS